MLETLHISNYALIDSIDIDFRPGFNIITGETGAGKSIILGALALLLGGRADTRTITDTSKKSVIEAAFRIEDNDAIKAYCTENDIECDDTTFIMRRELSPSGRSRAFINDSPVNLTAMHDAGALLIDIHSQHQNQLLAGADFQRRVIDAVAGNNDLLARYSRLYAEFREAMKKFKAAKNALDRDRDNADFMEFQLAQLDNLDLHDDELRTLEEEREELSEQTELRSYIIEAADALSEGENNILSQLSRVKDACSEISQLFDSSDDIINRLETARVELSDIADTISDLMSASSSASPEELGRIESRISSIRSLMRKHNVDSDADLITLHMQLRQRLENLSEAPEILAELEKEARAARRRAMETARTISERRRQAAETFARQLTETAVPLGMKNLRCVIDVQTAEMSATGIDSIEFRFAFNKNQTPTAIAGAASGGEISRLMLSVKSIVAQLFSLPAIIFDEIDTGVSGDVAARIADMMDRMSGKLQVITITHLPQVAARGATHFKVFKTDDESATHTSIVQLSDDRRVDEIALMLSGDSSDEAARANARALLATFTPQSDNN